MATHLAVIAKSPTPGTVKTRLCPPCTPAGAAAVALAALTATLATIDATSASHRTLVLDGAPGPWTPAGFAVVPQTGDGLADRLHHALTDCLAIAGPVLLVGMDTPQVEPRHLLDARRLLDDADAVLGPATDGGYWLIGLRSLHEHAFRDVEMSTDRTYEQQRRSLERCGYRVADAATLRDVDTAEDAVAVAALAPASEFARVVRRQIGPW